MQNSSSRKNLEEQVRELAVPLGSLIESLDPKVKPIKRLSYDWGDNFNDEFAQWSDDAPPPWTGEERVR